MPKLLRRLKLLEASLVDCGANQHAAILLWKRADLGKGDSDMPALDDDTKALLASLEEQIGDLTKANADLSERVKEAETEAGKAKEDLDRVKKGKPPKSDDDDDDPILKGMSPAVRQAYEDMRKERSELSDRISKQEERSEIEDCEKKIGKRFPNLPARPSNLAPIYRKISKALAPDELMSLDKIFASHSAAMAQLGEEAGHTGVGEYEGDGGADAWATIEQRAREVRKLQPTLSQEQAVTQVMEQDPKLYDAYRRETM